VAGVGAHAITFPRITGRSHVDMSIALNRRPGLLLDGRPDVVHLSGGPGGLQLLRRLPVPVVFTAHHTYRQAHGALRPERLMAVAESVSYRRADAVAAVSPTTAEAVRSMGVDPARVEVIAQGFDPLVGDPAVAKEPGRLLFVGRLEPEKGPLEAIAVMERVARDVPGARGVVVGSGSLEQAVRARAEVSGGVVTYLGRLDTHGLGREYRAAQLVLVPSAYEGRGIVALEAMAAGAVPVGYDVAGLHDTIGAAGALVGFGDVDALAAAAVGLLTDTARHQDLVDAGAEVMAAQQTWDRCATQVEDLYRRVLARYRP